MANLMRVTQMKLRDIENTYMMRVHRLTYKHRSQRITSTVANGIVDG